MEVPLDLLVTAALVLLGTGFALGSLPAYAMRKRIRHQGHLVEIRNNPLGWETVLLDGQTIHSGFAFGGTYKFMIGAEHAGVRIGYRWHLLGVTVRFMVNGEPYYED